MSAAVEIDQLHVIRGGNDVLHEVAVSIPSGKVTGLMGPSGCGKSTFMRAIVGVQKLAGGSISVLGSPAGSKSLRSQVGYVTQSPSVYNDLTVGENLGYFARVFGVGEDRVETVIEQVDLGRYKDRVVSRLSGGQRSRVSLAAALLHEPELLVLDEPTVGLDPVLRESLWELFHEIAEGGASLLVSSHVMDEAARCSELLLMRDGAVLAQITPDELLSRTGKHEMEDAFLALIRSMDSR